MKDVLLPVLKEALEAKDYKFFFSVMALASTGVKIPKYVYEKPRMEIRAKFFRARWSGAEIKPFIKKVCTANITGPNTIDIDGAWETIQYITSNLNSDEFYAQLRNRFNIESRDPRVPLELKPTVVLNTTDETINHYIELLNIKMLK